MPPRSSINSVRSRCGLLPTAKYRESETARSTLSSTHIGPPSEITSTGIAASRWRLPASSATPESSASSSSAAAASVCVAARRVAVPRASCEPMHAKITPSSATINKLREIACMSAVDHEHRLDR
jgi:hypothetical protein